jgi:DNA-binding transcriptional ArsR family regulator
MPRGKSRNVAGDGLPALVEPRLVKALDHVLRQHILLAAVQGEVSPSGLSKALDEGLSQVSYHVKVLRDDCEGMIVETRTEPRRGAVEHYYRAGARTLLPAKAWRRLKKGLRAVVGAGQASDLFNDLAEALKAGKLQGAHDHITRTPLVLDAEGQRNVQAIAQRATEEVEDGQRASAWRRATATAARPPGTPSRCWPSRLPGSLPTCTPLWRGPRARGRRRRTGRDATATGAGRVAAAGGARRGPPRGRPDRAGARPSEKGEAAWRVGRPSASPASMNATKRQRIRRGK